MQNFLLKEYALTFHFAENKNIILLTWKFYLFYCWGKKTRTLIQSNTSNRFFLALGHFSLIVPFVAMSFYITVSYSYVAQIV